MTEILQDPFAPIDAIRHQRLRARAASALCFVVGTAAMYWSVGEAAELPIMYSALTLLGGLVMAEGAQGYTSEITAKREAFDSEIERTIYACLETE